MINNKLLILTLSVSSFVGISAGQNNPNPNGNPEDENFFDGEVNGINDGNAAPRGAPMAGLAEIQAARAGLRPVAPGQPPIGPENLAPHQRIPYALEHFDRALLRPVPPVAPAEGADIPILRTASPFLSFKNH